MMNFASSWRLSLALAGIAMLVAFAAWPASGPKSAHADVDSVSPDAMYGESGDNIDIDIAGNEDATSGLSVTASGSSTLDNGACTDEDGVDCGAESGAGDPVTWGTVNGPYTATAVLILSCTEPEAVTVTATHNGDSTPVATVYCVPDLSDEDVEVEKDADDNDHYTFAWDTSGGDCLVLADDGTIDLDNDGSFDLQDNEDARFYCESGVFLEVEEIDDHDFVRIDDCENDDGVDVNGSWAEFDIDDLDATAFCRWINREYVAPVAPTTIIGPAATVSIVLSDATIDCGGSTLVQVIPRSSSGGAVSAGTTIIMTSSLGGTFQPASTVTSQFPVTLANFLYTAPSDAHGTTTITARVGNVQTTAAIQIVCEVAPATTVAPLAPPSAGDGGLLASSGSSYLPAALAIAAAAAVLGLTAATRRFAAETPDTGYVLTPSAASSAQPGGLALLASFVMLVVALLVRRWR